MYWHPFICNRPGLPPQYKQGKEAAGGHGQPGHTDVGAPAENQPSPWHYPAGDGDPAVYNAVNSIPAANSAEPLYGCRRSFRSQRDHKDSRKLPGSMRIVRL